MQVHIEIDGDLIDEVRRLGGHRTRKSALRAALREYIERRNQTRIFELFGKIDYDPEYDYKRARQRKAQ